MKIMNKIMMIALFAIAHNGTEKAIGGNSATWAPQNFEITKNEIVKNISISTTNVDNLLTAIVTMPSDDSANASSSSQAYLGVVARSSKKKQGMDVFYNDDMQNNLQLQGIDLESSKVIYLGKISSNDATAIGGKLNAAFQGSDHDYTKKRHLFGIKYNPEVRAR